MKNIAHIKNYIHIITGHFLPAHENNCITLLLFSRHTAYSLQNKFFGQNPGRIWINNVHCLGGEQSLLNCNHSTDSRDIQCTSKRAAGVNCK